MPQARKVNTDFMASPGDTPLRPMTVLLFRFDSSAIARADQEELVAASDWITAHPGQRLVIEGYTDTTGTYAYNAGLASRRASAVRDGLIAFGADPDRLVVGVFGEAKATSPSNAANRRVIIRGSSESLATITSRVFVDGMAVVWSYQPDRAVARR